MPITMKHWQIHAPNCLMCLQPAREKSNYPPMWWNQRRPEIVEGFEKEVYGRLPKNIPNVKWEVEITDYEQVGFTPVVAKKLLVMSITVPIR